MLQSHGSRAVLQFYPENSSQAEFITSQALKSGFTGGLVVDYPNTKAKKFFLVLMTGGSQTLPAALIDIAPKLFNWMNWMKIKRRNRTMLKQ